MAIREWHVMRALASFRELIEVIDQLTEEEVLFCLQKEVETRRRQTIVDRLFQQAAELNRQSCLKSLKEKFKWPVPQVLS